MLWKFSALFQKCRWKTRCFILVFNSRASLICPVCPWGRYTEELDTELQQTQILCRSASGTASSFAVVMPHFNFRFHLFVFILRLFLSASVFFWSVCFLFWMLCDHFSVWTAGFISNYTLSSWRYYMKCVDGTDLYWISLWFHLRLFAFSLGLCCRLYSSNFCVVWMSSWLFFGYFVTIIFCCLVSFFIACSYLVSVWSFLAVFSPSGLELQTLLLI